MRYTLDDLQWGPSKTPPVVSFLIIAICAVSIVTALLNKIAFSFGYSPVDMLSLTPGFITSFQLWKPVTFLLQSPGHNGITGSFLINLLFACYVIWFMGSDIVERLGKSSFLKIFFGAGILSGFIVLYAMYQWGRYPSISGPGPGILALFIVWSMIYPNRELFLFFIIKIEARWLVAGVLAAIFLVNLSQGDFKDLWLYLLAALLGYLYAVAFWGLRSPFPKTHAFDDWLSKAASSRWPFKKDETQKSKIFDFRTGETIQSDEEFLDEMLVKISKHGESSLTRKERARLERISQNRKQ